MPKDYYQILGVEKTASQEEVKKAYRQKALLIHPDINPSEEALAAFQELSEAYEILGYSDNREDFDSDKIIIRFEEFEDETHRQTAEREWRRASSYGSEAGSTVDTDYEHYQKSTTRIGFLVFLFSLTFFVDGLFDKKLGEMQVQKVTSVFAQGRSAKELSHLIITLKDFTFKKDFDEVNIAPGELISIKKSLIYGFVYFKKRNSEVFQRANGYPLLIYITAGLVFICGLIGISNKSSAASKFNVAIIGLFFSLALVIFLLSA
jgi:hypothetical protein